MTVPAKLQRYRPLIDDWAAFEQALQRPLPICIWTNPLRLCGPRLSELLTTEGIPHQRLAWSDSHFRLGPEVKPGLPWPFLAGLYHVQEEVSMLPPLLLEPQPGERVLDTCAAPGNKTAQLAAMMKNRGTVVANDRDYVRLKAVRQTLDRLGLLNVTTTQIDARRFPAAAGRFDRVLVDAPCTGEGTSRKNPNALRLAGPERSRALVATQTAILAQAVAHCKPGGRIVYATCTYAPEENEAVVDAILKRYPDSLRLRPARLENVRHSQGITHWNGQRFDDSLALAMRIWPHQNDSGGFFIAVLEKTAATARDVPPAEIPAPANLGRPVDTGRWLTLLNQRFGLPADVFGDFVFIHRQRDRLHLLRQDHQPPAVPSPATLGLPFLNVNLRYPKLSTPGAMLFATNATRNIIELSQTQLETYFRRGSITLQTNQTAACTDYGYVLLRYREFGLGVGMYQPARNGLPPQVQSLYPKAWSPATST